MKVAVLGGSGQMGRVAVRALVAAGHEVVVADRQPPAQVAPGVEVRTVDASTADAVGAAVDGVDAVMSFVGPYYRFGAAIAAAVVDAGLPFIDVCDDADVTLEILALHDRAAAAGVPVVTGAGGSPGVLNAIARVAGDGFDRIEKVLTAWVLEPRGEGSLATVAHTLHCIADPYPSWSDGGLITMRAADEPDPVTVSFPAPIGDVRVRNMGHPEPVTLGPVIGADEIRILGGIVPDIAFDALFAFVRLGMAGTDPIPLPDGRQLSPRDFLTSFMAHQGEPGHPEPDQEKIGLHVEVAGWRDGAPATRTIGFANHGTLADCTALPAVAGLSLLLDGQVEPGVHGPEAFDPALWLTALDAIAPRLFDRFWLTDDDEEPRSLTAQDLRDRWVHSGLLRR